jgi:hypothetical protein
MKTEFQKLLKKFLVDDSKIGYYESGKFLEIKVDGFPFILVTMDDLKNADRASFAAYTVVRAVALSKHYSRG